MAERAFPAAPVAVYGGTRVIASPFQFSLTDDDNLQIVSVNSLAGVVAPTISAALLGMVSHLSPGDWRVGAPFFFCAGLQFAGTLVALRHFRRRSYAATPAVDASISS